MPDAVWVIVVAGGSGQRFGRLKQFELLGEKTVLARSIDGAHSVTDNVIVVLPADQVDGASDYNVTAVVAGGASRAASVRCGLAVVPSDAEIVLIHDAARPLASPSLFGEIVKAIENGADGAIPGLAVSDTIKTVQNGVVSGTLDRSSLVAVQTPQGFRLDVLRKAHEGEPDATDDAGLVEALGRKVVVVPGEATNVKLTEQTDLALLKAAIGESA